MGEAYQNLVSSRNAASSLQAAETGGWRASRTGFSGSCGAADSHLLPLLPFAVDPPDDASLKSFSPSEMAPPQDCCLGSLYLHAFPSPCPGVQGWEPPRLTHPSSPPDSPFPGGFCRPTPSPIILAPPSLARILWAALLVWFIS